MILHARPWQHREHHPPAAVRTLVDLLLHRAQATPDLPIFRHLVDGDETIETLTLGELARQARAIAVLLARRLPVGARVLLPHPPGLEFAAALLGCMFAGMVGVPVPPPDAGRRGPALRRLLSICADAEVAAILTIPAVLAAGDELRAALPDVPWLTTTDLDLELADEWTAPPDLAADTVAYLQYTSGSTADPKGVVIDHANLLHNCAALNEAYVLRPASVMVYWVPTYHDLGLVYGIALPLFIGFTAVSMPAAAFLARPIRWLRAISRFAGTHSVAPNFGYELVVARTKPEERHGLDLSSWRHALNGAEPIRQAGEQSFITAFAPHNFHADALSHSYGMSEATAELSSEPLEKNRGVFLKIAADALERGRVVLATDDTARTRIVAGCGVPTGDTHLYIIDPDTRIACPEDQIGEVWIRGASVARGYWRADAATERTFQARRADDLAHVDYLRSGDLGFVRDGQLFITGRRKDLIIIRGENHYPQDLEWSVQGRHPAVRPNSAVALAIDAADGERLVLISEVYPEQAADPEPVFAALREAAAEYGLQLACAVLCPPGAIPKTSSGKVQRGPTKQLLLTHELRTLARWDLPTTAIIEEADEDLRDTLRADLATRATILRDYLTRLIAARLHVPAETLSLSIPLTQHGLDSLAAVEICERLSFQLCAPVELGELHDGRSIPALAEDLAARQAELPLRCAPEDRHEPFPLHGIQQAYWVGRAGGALGGVSCHAYHELDTTDLDLPRLERAWNFLISRHDALRLVISSDGRQRVLPEVPAYTITCDDLKNLDPAARESHLLAVREQMSHQVLPADQWPLFAIKAHRLDDHHTRIHLGIDLLLADGASLALLMHEWSLLYAGHELPAHPPCSFRDCALADLAARDTDRYRASLAYWSAHRPDFATTPELPLARRPEDLSGPARFIRRRAVIPTALWTALDLEARRRHLSPSIILCAAFTEVLTIWSARPEFMLNMTTFRRAPIHPRVHEIVGDFTTMALLTCRPAASFAALAQALQDQFHEQLDHRIVNGVEVLREWSRGGAIQVPVVFTSMVRSDGTGQWDTAWLGDEVHAISQTPHVWLDHQVLECNGELVSRWDAVEALFPAGLLDAMFSAFHVRIAQLAADPSTWDAITPELLPEAQRLLITEVNETASPCPSTTLPALFHAQTRARPSAPALIASDRTFSYAALAALSTRLARQLRDQGARPNTLVAIVMNKGWEQVAAALAIVESGAAYLPIDASLPPERCKLLLARGQAALALTTPDLDTSFPWPAEITRILVEDSEDRPLDADTKPLEPIAGAHDLAYVLFTSGSTGEPKGVMIEHHAAVNTILDINHRHGIGPDDRAIALSSLSFDLSVHDMFGMFAAGGAIVVPSPAEREDPALWAAPLARGVTFWNTVPALMQLLVDHARDRPALAAAASGLRCILLSGDWIPLPLPEAIRRLCPDAAIISLGGATEAAIWSIEHPIKTIDPAWVSIPYGRPLANQRFHVLDAALQPRPIWVPGELYIAGDGLARGYWDDPVRTDAAFLYHPRTGERLYRTGDWGRWLPDGSIEFLGRRDQQIKINGHRIEIGEIEACLLRHPAVRQATVLAVGDRSPRLIAHVALNPDVIAPDLHEHCRAALPGYMVPAGFHRHDRLPLTANGKLDRAALTRLGASPTSPSQPRTSAPRDLVEQIAREAAAAFDLPDVDPLALFSDLGVDSVMALRLRSRLTAALGRELPLTLAYDYPSVMALARHLGPATTTPTINTPRRSIDTAEPIAIVAMACRLPGAIETPEDLWAVLDEGRDVTSEVPPTRWNAAAVHSSDGKPGTTYCTRGGFLGDVQHFDAEFFGLAPREARALDPQQRLLLEVTWETLERAGIPPATLNGQEVGVYVGLSAHEYAWMEGHSLAEVLDGYGITGTTASTASGRLAYVLGLEGPALTVDTACSSSLVTVHLACQALRAGECSMALAGGVTLLQTPQLFIEFSRLQGLAPDGRSKAFSAAADGVGWSEGCGMVLLKRLTDAQRDGDPILAVIRGNAVNQDGHSNGLTAPNGPAQARVIRRALELAQCSPADVDQVEAHGTGTRLGDPIEARAVAQVYGRDRPDGAPLWLGSSKSNMGHTLSAAGVAGLMKIALSLIHARMPRTLHAELASPHIDWQHSGLALLQTSQPWPPRPDRPRLGGISSFGVSGTNAHIIVQEAPPHVITPTDPRDSASPRDALLISGKTDAALRAQATRWADWLAAHPGTPWSDVLHTAARRRTHFRRRAALHVDGPAAAITALRALADGRSSPDLVTQTASGRLAVLFTGQGSQRPGMGTGLATTHPVFRDAFAQALAQLDLHLDQPLASQLHDAHALESTRLTQPALFALEVALYRQWEAWGLEPEFLIGHSVGELAAAHVAGVLSLADAARLVCARGRLMQSMPTGGAMASIAASEAELLPFIGPGLAISGLAGPRQSVVSGDLAAVQFLQTHFAALGRRTHRLAVSHAFHSSHMDGMLDDLASVVATCTFRPPRIPIISTLTGRRVADHELADPAYWTAQARHTVRFLDAVQTAWAAGARIFLECGPDGTLSAMAPGCVPDDAPAAFIPSLFKNNNNKDLAEPDALARARSAVHVAGVTLEPRALGPDHGELVPLPTYAWQRALCWRDPPAPTADGTPARFELGGAWRALPDGGYLHELHVGTRAQPYLADHRVLGQVVAPGTFHVAVILALAAERWPGEPVVISDLFFRAPLLLDEGRDVLLSAHLRPHADGFAVTLATRDRELGIWRTHVEAHISRADRPPIGLPAPQGEPDLTLGFTDLVTALAAVDVVWGPRWSWTAAILRHGDRIVTRLQRPTDAPSDAHAPISPVLLDNASAAGMAHRWPPTPGGAPRLPFAIERLIWSGRSSEPLEARRQFHGDLAAEAESADLSLHDRDGICVVSISGMSIKRAPRDRFLREQSAHDLFHIVLEAQDLPPPQTPTAQVVLASPRLAALLGLPNHPDLTTALTTSDAHALADNFDDTQATSSDVSLTTSTAHALTTDTTSPVRRILVDLDASAATDPADLRLRLNTLATLITTWLALPTSAELVFLASTPHPLLHGALAGLLRAIRQEHPDRSLRLITLTDDIEPTQILRALELPEPELELGRNILRAPRLRKLPPTSPIHPPALNTGTVLITGGTGELGRVLARHLISKHGARHLLLVSRRGPAAPDAAALQTELESLGATVSIAACDVTDRHALKDLLASIPELTAVFHLAGALDDGLFTAITPARRDLVLAPKLDGAWHLDALTRERPLAAFVLFSSAAGLLGSPGQSSYAAANAALDALAADRHAHGHPATSVVWGPWESLGMTASLSAGDLARMRREGLSPLPTARALALLDAALCREEPVLALLDLDLRAPRDVVPPLLRGLVAPARNPAGAELRARLAPLSERERLAHLLDLTRTEIATTLGLGDAGRVPTDLPLHELGLDSLMAVDLRNRLTARTRVPLPSTLAFDHPNAAAIAALLNSLLGAIATPTLPPPPLTDTTDNAIAVIGMACRFPGGVEDPEALWQLLARGEDAVSDVPARRFDIDAWYDPDPAHIGTTYARTGGFIGDVTGLDAGFFRVAPIEARSLDPQGRLLLECSWEALERAGIVPETLVGSNTGVYVGLCGTEYVIDAMADERAIDAYSLLGTAHSAIAGRLSYWLGLQGPNLPVDTACSASLVALHLAVRALRAGECDLAITGGANLLLSPEGFVYFSRLQALSPTGRSRAFSADADGYVRAEGCGVLILKRLADARRDGDPILALVRGSAVNQDGRSNGFTAPNGPSQERVIRRALADAGLTPASIDLVECHGTGTALGDPIEVQALAAVYGEHRDPHQPIVIGSIKSNIGHTEGAAGVAGVMKAILSLQHRHIPATLHVGRPNQHVPWDTLKIRIAVDAQPFPERHAPARAAVSAFGFSGTNAHIILEEATPHDSTTSPSPASPAAPHERLPLLLSGRGPALPAQAARIAAWLRARPGLRLLDVIHSAAIDRTHFPERAALHVDSIAAALETLDALAAGRPHPFITTGSAREVTGVVFVFSGQGGQWPAMGRALLEQSPAFAATIAACDAAFAAFTDLSVRAILAGELTTPLDRPASIQPALYALGLGLVAAWRELGVEPAAVVGHSLGEVTAAVVAGALTLEDGARIVAHRSRLLQDLTDPGDIAHIELPEAEARRRIAPWGETLCVAGVNSPGATIIAGAPAALDALLASLRADAIFCRPIAMGYASHSPHVEPMLAPFAAALHGLRPQPTRIPLYSTITGELTPGEALGPDHWPRNLRQPVRLDRALTRLRADGHLVLLEVGPHPVLNMALHAGAPPHGHIAASLNRGEGERATLLRNLAGLHVHGLTVDWSRALADLGGARIMLPTYAFQRERHWLPARTATRDLAAIGLERVEHPIVRTTAALADADSHLFTGSLSAAEQPWLADHVILGVTLFPATGWLELALAAARQLGHTTLAALTLAAPLALTPTDRVQLQIAVDTPDHDGRRKLRIHTRRAGAPWTCNAHGQLAPIHDVSQPLAPNRDLPWPPPGEPVDLDALHAEITRAGVDYGPSFRGLIAAWRDGSRIFAELSAPDNISPDGHVLHPALLDAALHVLALSRVGVDLDTAMLPVAWSEVVIHTSGASELRARIDLDDSNGPDHATLALHLTDTTGRPVLDIGALQFQRASLGQLQGASPRPLHRIDWQPVALAPDLRDNAAQPLVLGDGPLARALGQRAIPDLAALLERLEHDHPSQILIDATGSTDLDTPLPTHPITTDLDPIASSHTNLDPIASRHTNLDPIASSHHAAELALECMQTWLREPRLAACELVWISRAAMATDIHDPGPAAAWGLLRSARQEHPDRAIRLIDLGPDILDQDLLHRALAHRDEPELALRDHSALAPRLQRAPSVDPHPLTLDPDGLVWISGAGELATTLARHLVEHHHVRHLLLSSRRGPDTPGAAALVDRLHGLGATVTFAAADSSDRGALANLLNSLERPLTAVFHLAGILDDGVVTSLTPARLARVLAAKADGAWHLHTLTRERPLAAFVVFSSLSGLLGGEGQASYAAANAVLDALATHRHAQGLPAHSLAWGLWDGPGMAAGLTPRDLARLRERGFPPCSPAQALRWLDEALQRPEPCLVPALLDLAALRRSDPPALLRALVPPRPRAAADLRPPKKRPHGERETLDLVRAVIASVVGASIEAIHPDLLLRDLGLDSLMAVKLRNELGARTGASLPVTLVYDYPTPIAIADLLKTSLPAESAPEAHALESTESPAAQHEPNEPIAIVGMSCRVPGDVDDPEAFWHLLAEGRDVIGPFPARWDTDAIHDPDPDVPGKTYAREGGFITNLADFDAGFFGIAPREAVTMDPQQRLLLEAAWEALEHANIRPADLRGSQTGVYIGAARSEYNQNFTLESLDGHGGTGTATSIMSGRIAYALGLHGPAITLDTACSASLVAIHLACAAIRAGDCDLALAGGVQALISPAIFVEFSRLRGLARDGRCKSFAAGADGAGWSEGVGLLVLKRLSHARRDGDRIVALVRGSASNQDGRSQGMTAPNGPAQQRVVRRALQASGLQPGAIDYVEAHGTGTALGDPIEAGALAEVFGPGRPTDRPLRLGSCKSNIGHTQAAAGVLGVIKVALALEHEQLPRTIHAEHPTPHVDWARSGLALVQQPTPWPRDAARPRRAGISSFGISGTNAHVILEEAPASTTSAPQNPILQTTLTATATPATPTIPEATSTLAATVTHATPTIPLLLSGRDDAALRDQAARLAHWLTEHPQAAWSDILHTAAVRRTHHAARAALTVADASHAIAALTDLTAGRPDPTITLGHARSRGKLVFVLPGQGSQWPGMGRDLLNQSADFAEIITACDHALRPLTGWSLLAVLRGDPDAAPLERVDVVQPTLFAMALGLAATWRALGIEPDAVVGHSQGEIAAAVIAGALTLEHGARVVALRSRLVRGLGRAGAMLVVEHPIAELEPLLQQYEPALTLAVVNAADSAVVAGDVDAIAALATDLDEQGIFCRRVDVDYASHCSAVDPILDELTQQLTDLRPGPTRIPFYSTVTGEITPGEALGPDYWRRNLREPVRLDRAGAALLTDHHDIFLELSARPILAIPLRRLAAARDGLVLASLRRDLGGLTPLLESLGALHVHGHPVDWQALAPGAPVPLPNYAWQREPYWLADPPPPPTGAHPLLGRGHTTSLRPGARLWPIELDLRAQPYLADHQVLGATLLPGSGVIELLLTAGRQLFGERSFVIEDLDFQRPIALHQSTPWTGELIATRSGDAWSFKITRSPDPDADLWHDHATATLRPTDSSQPTDPQPTDSSPLSTNSQRNASSHHTDATALRPPAELRARCDLAIPPERHLAAQAARGLQLGSTFQSFIALWQGPREACAHLVLASAIAGTARSHSAHPALLDAALGLSGAAAHADVGPDDLWLLAGIHRLQLHAPLGREVWAHAAVTPDGDHLTGRIEVRGPDGALRMQLEGVTLRRIERPTSGPAPFLAPRWRTAGPPAAQPSTPGTWLLIGDSDDLGATLELRLRAHDIRLQRSDLDDLDARLADRPHTVILAGELPPLADPASLPRTDAITLDTTDVATTLSPGLDLSAPELLADEAAHRSDRLLRVVQALARADLPTAPRLFILTRGAQPIDLTTSALTTSALTETPDPASADLAPSNLADAPLWGLGRSLALEHPEFACTRIDLDPAHPPGEADLLLRELLAAPGHDEVALRGPARLLVRLERLTDDQLPARRAASIRPDATYLLTGGLGGLGLLTAGWLADAGARHLVLASRREPDPAQSHALAELRARGVDVEHAAVDIADAPALQRLLHHIALTRPPLRGVFHLAGVLADSLVLHQTHAQLRAVFAPKVRGALLLDRLTRDLELDHFVLYSSAAALLGAPGMGSYSAANAFLGALAHQRRRAGHPALAIDWGLFSGVGMGHKADAGGRAVDRGISSFTPEHGRALLHRLLHVDLAELAVVALDARRWLAADPLAARFDRLAALVAEGRAAAPSPDTPGLIAELRHAPIAEHPPIVERFVREQVGRVLRLAPTRIDPRQLLQDLGVDSVMGLELRNHLQTALGQSLPATLIWTFPTVEQIAAHLVTRWRAANPTAPDPTTTIDVLDDPTVLDGSAVPAESDDLDESPVLDGSDDLLADFDTALADIDRLVRR